MQGFGVLLFMWGGLDFFMGEQDVDVYYDWFGIYLPDAIYNYSHWSLWPLEVSSLRQVSRANKTNALFLGDTLQSLTRVCLHLMGLALTP